MHGSGATRTHRSRTAALALAIVLVAAACGGGGSDKSSSSSGSTGDSSAGKPVYGGKVTYGLEAENSNGWCLPEGQLAISGIMVARTIYDTLTVPNDKGEYKPFLASSVDHDPTYTQWTIKLRPGIKFHDGTALDSTVVKNNLDAYRGKYPGRSSLLFSIVLDNITDVTAPDPMTVTITTKTPWPALPSYLYSSGRLGIMAQAQLDDKDTCDTKLIGTGPFKLKEWKVNDHLTAVKNPDYWLKDSSGNKLPYLDEIEFRPIIEPSARAVGAGQWPAQRRARIDAGDHQPAAHPARQRQDQPVGVQQVPGGRLRDAEHVDGAVRQPTGPQGGRRVLRPGGVQQGPQPGHRRRWRRDRSGRARSATSRTPACRSTTRNRPRRTSRPTRPRPASPWSSRSRP